MYKTNLWYIHTARHERREKLKGDTALGVGDGVIASLPVRTAGNGMRNRVLGPNGAHKVGGSGFGRSCGVEMAGRSSSSASSASLQCGVPFDPSGAAASRSAGPSSIVSGLGRRASIAEQMSAKSFSPVHSPTSSVSASYPLAVTMWVLNRWASVLERSVRGALNWLTQNLVSAQWLSRYLDCARERADVHVGALAYQSQIGRYERGFDVHERRRGKARWIRFGSSGDHHGRGAWRQSETRTSARTARTGQLLDARRIEPSFAVPVLHDSNVDAERVHEVDDFPESVHQRGLSLSHVPRAAMHRQRAHASPYDPLDERLRLLLSRQETDLCRHGDLRGEFSAQRRQDGAQAIWIGEQRGPHARMCAERFRTPAVEIDAGDVLYDGLGGLDGEFGGGGADLVDEIGFFDRVGGEDGAGLAVVGDDAGVGWTGVSGGRGRGGVRTVDDAFRVQYGPVHDFGAPDEGGAVFEGGQPGRHCESLVDDAGQNGAAYGRRSGPWGRERRHS
jgi:hypothetical protein